MEHGRGEIAGFEQDLRRVCREVMRTTPNQRDLGMIRGSSGFTVSLLTKWMVHDISLWVGHGSKAAEEKRFFDYHLAPFYRIEQLVLATVPVSKNAMAPSIVTDQNMKLLFEIQKKVDTLHANYSGSMVSLADICLKPLADDCATQSVLQHFSSEETCRSAFQAPLDPGTVLGGFSGSNYSDASAFIITYPVNNEAGDTGNQNGKAVAWERAFIRLTRRPALAISLCSSLALVAPEELVPLVEPQNLTLSFSSESSIQDELERESSADVVTILVSYLVMFAYISFAVGDSPQWPSFLVTSKVGRVLDARRMQVQLVRGQIRLLDGGSICFGLSDYPVSEFELVAEELLISDSIIKACIFLEKSFFSAAVESLCLISTVYGAFRMYVKMLLMWDSKIQIDDGGNHDVGASMLEARNLIVLRQNSVISSNGDLGVYGQGLLKLSGSGDVIEAQRLFLSLFYNIEVGPGSLLQAPVDNEIGSSSAAQAHCESQTCPKELLMPPDDCHVNNSLSLTLQICRVEDLTVHGLVRGTIIHIHRARTVVIHTDGEISGTGLGCKEGIGKGKYLKHGAGGGAGHGGKGGSGYSNGTRIEGGQAYGDADLPCELGSGSGGSNGFNENGAAGGGMIVMGSMKWPLSRLDIHGLLKADGQSYATTNYNGSVMRGFGGGSGGTILLFLQTLVLEKSSSLSVAGGNGGPSGGGGGGGGRIHFDWSNMATGDEYVQFAFVNVEGQVIVVVIWARREQLLERSVPKVFMALSAMYV
ncbi:hypothetical protein MA16_Dca021955 [Dendrobium catenatum]|uniref:NPC1 middle luminal domain-containing protein n=1 Tax=Dendrobium catenatum TaxID=906689 RepID=A0A2I0X436_9ASPA|nr:hypothetical protein MA16_Dca021955 [Dendrobium catenatum]